MEDENSNRKRKVEDTIDEQQQKKINFDHHPLSSTDVSHSNPSLSIPSNSSNPSSSSSSIDVSHSNPKPIPSTSSNPNLDDDDHPPSSIPSNASNPSSSSIDASHLNPSSIPSTSSNPSSSTIDVSHSNPSTSSNPNLDDDDDDQHSLTITNPVPAFTIFDPPNLLMLPFHQQLILELNQQLILEYSYEQHRQLQQLRRTILPLLHSLQPPLSPPPPPPPPPSHHLPLQPPSAEPAPLSKPPHAWATKHRARVHPMKYLIDNHICEISSIIKCNKCPNMSLKRYTFLVKFRQVAKFVERVLRSDDWKLRRRVPEWWTNPRLERCTLCRNESSCTPVISEKKKSINWLFLVLGHTVGCCSTPQLRYFFKHNSLLQIEPDHEISRDVLICNVYYTLCSQIDPDEFLFRKDQI